MTSTVNIDTADFYNYEQLLSAEERATLHRVHDFMTTEVQPVLLEHWSKSTFPFEIVPGFSGLGISPASTASGSSRRLSSGSRLGMEENNSWV